jgi:hypothetical protein
MALPGGAGASVERDGFHSAGHEDFLESAEFGEAHSEGLVPQKRSEDAGSGAEGAAQGLRPLGQAELTHWVGSIVPYPLDAPDRAPVTAEDFAGLRYYASHTIPMNPVVAQCNSYRVSW